MPMGKFPAVNYYLTLNELENKEKKYPLNFCICGKCALGQLDEIVRAGDLFSTYHYISSTSAPLKNHLETLVKLCIDMFKLNKNSKVLDIGCNDGTLLLHVKKSDIQTFGVDPAENVSDQTRKSGIKIVSDFFTKKLSQRILKKEGKFDLIFATNTLAQVVDLNDFVKGVKILLKDHGTFVIEVGYLLEMITRGTFDSIYHEHYSYFSLMSLQQLFEQNDLEVYDAEKIENHGGSLRAFIKHKENKNLQKTKQLARLFEKEQKMGLKKKKAYKEFVDSALKFKKDFYDLLVELKKDNKTIVGIGAPAKSVILLNFAGVDHKIISYITDSTPYKQNRFMPGVHIPIMNEEKLRDDHSIDYYLLLAWTYQDTIIKKLKELRKEKINVVFPFPKLKVSQM